MTSLSLSGAYRGGQADCELLNKNWAGRGATLLHHGWRAVSWVRPANGERSGFSGDARHGAFVQRVVKACVLLIALMTSGPGWSAGLGRLTLTSTAGQPFHAEIELVAVKNEEKFALTAGLASQQLFRQANVEYLPLLATFQASIELRSNGQPYVRIISPQPVAEPLLNLLVELNWPSGRLVREYTVVLASPATKKLAGGRETPGASPLLPLGPKLLSGQTNGVDPWELLRSYLTDDENTEEEVLKQTVSGTIAHASDAGPVSSKEKEASREVLQVSRDIEPHQAEQGAAAGAAEIPPRPAGSQSGQSTLSSPTQNDPIRPVKATSVYEVTDEPVAVAKPMRIASRSVQSPDQGNGSSGRARRPALADLAMDLKFVGGALVLLLTGMVGVSIARRQKAARNPARENVASAVLGSSSALEALPVTTTATLNRETHATLPGGAEATTEVEIPPNTSDGRTELNPRFSGGSGDKAAEGQQSEKMKSRPPSSGSSGNVSPRSRASWPVERPLGGIDLNKGARSTDDVRRPLLERGMRSREILSQLDLARAYQEMGDKDAARQVLRDVIRDGDAVQRESARRILTNL